MPPVKIHSCLIQGLEGHLIEVEADIQRGMSAFTIVGLGDQSVQESKERIRSAIRSTNAEYPVQKKIINLAPASLKKQGPIFDLPIALSLLLASGQLAGAAGRGASTTAQPQGESDAGATYPLQQLFKDTLFIGELALNGELRPVPNAFSTALFARENGFRRLILPADNYLEASLIEDLEILGPTHLQQLIHFLTNGESIPTPPPANLPPTPDLPASPAPLYLSIQGQQEAKRALLIAAAGGHHLLLHGPPGIGKTMLAKSLPELLPPLSEDEFFETLRVYSAAKLSTEGLFRRERPFRQAHQSSSPMSLTGGGNPITPGEISLAHHGVLFLDEFPEFPRSVIESLRQPLEDRKIHIARQGTQVQFPAKFTLVAAMNPCPCGYFGDRHRECTCTAYQIHQYRQKLSGPILDRIDLTVALHQPRFTHQSTPPTPPLPVHKSATTNSLETAATRRGPATPPSTTLEDLAKLRLQVQIARERQHHRFQKTALHHNSDLGSGDLKRYLRLDPGAEEYLEIITERLPLSARAHTQLLRTALTIADLKNQDTITNLELAEAFQYKNPL